MKWLQEKKISMDHSMIQYQQSLTMYDMNDRFKKFQAVEPKCVWPTLTLGVEIDAAYLIYKSIHERVTRSESVLKILTCQV